MNSVFIFEIAAGIVLAYLIISAPKRFKAAWEKQKKMIDEAKDTRRR